ncbi:hypothetical protein [Phragmitibacter flavus]|nr:hypothetical protein [Phragmitibacter flavus]
MPGNTVTVTSSTISKTSRNRAAKKAFLRHRKSIGNPKPSPEVEEERRLASKLIREVDSTSSDVATLCDTYGLTREELGRLTGFSLRALAQWASGKLPSQPAKRRLHEIRRLLDALAEVIHLERLPVWMHESNTFFEGMTPLQVIEVGEIDRLWGMVYDLGSGQPD